MNVLTSSHKFTIVCIGHSFITRVSRFCNGDNLRLDKTQFSVIFIGQPGGTTRGPKSIQTVLHKLQGIRADLVFLQLGSNDLCDENREPAQVAQDIISIANFIHVAYDVGCVVIGDIIPRLRQDLGSFNVRASRANVMIHQACDAQSQIHFWHHRGFSNPVINPFAPDGVHPSNDAGMSKYARSVRHAILFFKSRLRTRNQ
jgi:lysophospholipase L1-like esterase